MSTIEVKRRKNVENKICSSRALRYGGSVALSPVPTPTSYTFRIGPDHFASIRLIYDCVARPARNKGFIAEGEVKAEIAPELIPVFTADGQDVKKAHSVVSVDGRVNVR